jgi:hypothetical protein
MLSPQCKVIYLDCSLQMTIDGCDNAQLISQACTLAENFWQVDLGRNVTLMDVSSFLGDTEN